MISHLTPERRELNFTIITNKHYGEFKYWPQVYEMWENRYDPRRAKFIDFTDPVWSGEPREDEMRKYCGRR